MTFTVRGYTRAIGPDLPATLACPAGTVEGDLLVAAVYPSETEPSGTWAANWYTGTIGTYMTVYVRAATAGDVADGVDFPSTQMALLLAVGGALPWLPGDWAGNDFDDQPAYWAFRVNGSNTESEVSYDFDTWAGAFGLYIANFDYGYAAAGMSRGTVVVDLSEEEYGQATLVHAELMSTTELTELTLSYVATGSYEKIRLIGLTFAPLLSGNDDFADAEPVTIASDGDTYISGVVINRDYTLETGEPEFTYEWEEDPDDVVGKRSAWWSYTPGTSGTATFDLGLSPASYSNLFVCTGTAVDALTVVAFDDDAGPGYTPLIPDLPVTGGTTYWIKAGVWYDTDDEMYVLRVTGPNTEAGGPALAVPPMQAEVEVLPYGGVATPDNFADAKTVTIPTNGDTFTSPAYPTANFTVESGEPGTTFPPLSGEVVDRTLWWSYTPTDNGTATVDTSPSEHPYEEPSEEYTPPLMLRLYTGTDLTDLVEVAAVDSVFESTWLASITWDVTAGTTYWIQVGQYDDDDMHDLGIAVTGPGTEDEIVIVAAPPMQVQASVPTPPVAVLAVELVDPVQGATVPTARPAFTVAVTRAITDDPVTVGVEVQVQSVVGSVYTAVMTLTDDVDLDSTTTYTTLVADEDLPAGSYVWQTRITYGAWIGDWTPPFTTVGTIAPAMLAFSTPITWTVDSDAAAAPHLWFVAPAAGRPGEQVTAYGHGLGEATSATIAGVAAEIDSPDLVAGTGATTSRIIDQLGAVVTAEHYEVVVTVPDVDPPGGPFTIVSE